MLVSFGKYLKMISRALKVIEKDTRSTVPRVIYEIETYGRDSFQRYIDRFNGVFTILELEKINK